MDDNFLEIDKHSLDVEWVRQPTLYFEIAEKLVEAKLDLEQSKKDLDYTRAQLDSKIRKAPEKYKIAKVVESLVASTILLQPGYKDAQEALIVCRREVGILDATLNALEHKKRALESLVSLHGQNYFSEPRASEEDAEALQEATRKRIRKGKRRKKTT